jgi:hypothetical protein
MINYYYLHITTYELMNTILLYSTEVDHQPLELILKEFFVKLKIIIIIKILHLTTLLST